MVKLSSLGSIVYGTAWKKEHTARLVIDAFKAGFRSVDTAGQPKHYREDLVGEALVQLYDEGIVKREDIWIQTKFTPLSGHDLTRPIPYDKVAPIPDRIAQSFASSQKNLGTEVIDSYLLHSPLPTRAETLEAWRVLAQMRREGKVRMIGISNIYDVGVLQALHEGSGEKCDIVQNRWYEGNHWSQEVLQYCRQHNIIFQSFWTLTGSPSLLAHPATAAISRSLGCTREQVIYKLAQSVGIIPLAGSSNNQHMHDGLGVAKLDISNDDVVPRLRELQKLVAGDS
ncbi:Aldo/keto reductase [Auriculariales sp. MPI-PUGE-AT-0066]|nr:Aldo/keto reductase [Auriculariales sp. MPI-PUGE-AT-0066]